MTHQMAQERMTQAEEESLNESTKVIKPTGPHVGKRVQIRKTPQANSDAVPERNKSVPVNPAIAVRKPRGSNNVSQRPYRDRIIHLLALKAYKKPELLLRLKKDGVNRKDKNSLGTILQQVANLNPKTISYSLRDHLYKELQLDWPGYDETDRMALELVLARKLNPPQNVAGTSPPESPVYSSRDTTSCPQERPLDSDFIYPSVSKKIRISHLTKRVPPTLNDHLNPTNEKSTTGFLPPPAAAAIPTPSTLPAAHLPVSDSPQTVNYNSNSSSYPEGWGVQDVPVDSFSQYRNIFEDHQDEYTSESYLETSPPRLVLPNCPEHMDEDHLMIHKESKKKSIKYKENDQIKTCNTEVIEEEEENLQRQDLDNTNSNERVQESCPDSAEPSSTIELPDYLLKYVPIMSYEQRQNYKDDFNAEYGEYRALYARVETVARKFIELDAKQKSLSPGSNEYESIDEEVLQEYQQIEESNPNYHEEKYRCEYLHNKLSHIKRIIVEFDQQQTESWY